LVNSDRKKHHIAVCDLCSIVIGRNIILLSVIFDQFKPLNWSLTNLNLLQPKCSDLPSLRFLIWNINTLDWVQNKAAQFANHTRDSDSETLAQRRTIARLCALFEAYSAERDWKTIRDRMRRPYYLSSCDHVWKVRDRKQRTDNRNYLL